MSTHDSVTSVNTSKRKANGHHRGHPSSVLGDVEDFARKGRALPRKVRRALTAQPEMMFALVGGTFFLAGAVFGSRLGRALLHAALPIAIERLLTGDVGPRLLAYAKDALNEAAT